MLDSRLKYGHLLGSNSLTVTYEHIRTSEYHMDIVLSGYHRPLYFLCYEWTPHLYLLSEANDNKAMYGHNREDCNVD